MDKPSYRPLYMQVKDILIDHIKNMPEGENQLPSEEVLKDQLEVSRATIREALTSLGNDGVVRKKHGRGNFAYPTVLDLPFRIDRYPDFTDLLGGKDRVSIKTSEYEIGEASAKMLRRMPEAEGHEIVKWSWEYFMDGQLAVYCDMCIPKDHFIQNPEYYIKDFAITQTIIDITYFISWMGISDDPDMLERFGCEAKMMQNWDQIFKDTHDKTICYCELFFNPDIVDLSIVTAL